MSNYKIHFSPTGGTLKCANLLAAGLAADWTEIDISLPCPEYTFTSDDLCIAAVPSFGGRVPCTASERLKSIHGNGAKAILLCVYGNRAFEDTLAELKDILEGSGFVCIAGVAALAEHSIMRTFAAGRPDVKDQNILSDYASAIKAKLAQCPSTLSVPGNHPYKEYKVAPMVPLTGEACLSCGLCAQNCPADAISPETPDQINADRCISCMRCVAICPQHARFIDPQKLNALTQRLQDALGGRKENELFL